MADDAAPYSVAAVGGLAVDLDPVAFDELVAPLGILVDQELKDAKGVGADGALVYFGVLKDASYEVAGGVVDVEPDLLWCSRGRRGGADRR